MYFNIVQAVIAMIEKLRKKINVDKILNIQK